MALTYHGGALLQGDLPVSILWYGNFSPAQKSIIADFLLSLNHKDQETAKPSVTQWWNSVQTYMKKAGQKPTNVSLSTQLSDHNCSLGKTLKKSQITELARRANFGRGRLTPVLTAPDVRVLHAQLRVSRLEPEVQLGVHLGRKLSDPVPGEQRFFCPGPPRTQGLESPVSSDSHQVRACAWPFHQPIYGPQTPPLVAPNADVGVNGMVVNIATLLAGTVTNPFANGFYLGSTEAPLEAASACTGVYGKGAYPGYAGELVVDANSGASYNAVGVNGRKYLLPALFDPYTSQCETIV
ncbi:hypothetical protein ACLB2K_046124 [Fragaria x ananassa]